MILVIALIVLGPDKLPSAARRIGAMWSDVKRWRAQLESEVRSAFPDLPPTTEIARAVRSPLSLLDRLADEHVGPSERSDSEHAASGPVTSMADTSATSPGDGIPRADASAGADAASMN
jgi:Sec-independent protein translocase protein TatA